jgi:hypothetical protein
MKQLLLVCILLWQTPALAQTVIFSQDFNSIPGYQINGWIDEYSNGGYPFRIGLPYLVGGACFSPPGNNTKVAGLTDVFAWPGAPCNSTRNDSNVLLYTPPINFTNVTGAWLQYDSYFLEKVSGSVRESARIEVSTDNGATWTLLQQVQPNGAGGFQTWYADMNAYNQAGNIRLGFRYSDSGMLMNGWMIDNIKIFIPDSTDLKLVRAAPDDSLLSYGTIGQDMQLGGQVFNAGLKPVTSFTVYYQYGSAAPVSFTINGISLNSFESLEFFHPIPFTIPAMGTHPIKMWVETAGDNRPANDSARLSLRGAAFMPPKMQLIEEGTGTWNGWGPRGKVLMKWASQSDYPVNLVSVHDQTDPMHVPDYQQFLFYLRWNYVPYFLFDRRENVPPDSFYNAVSRYASYFGFASLNAQATISNQNLQFTALVRPAIDLTGDYRLAVALTEDSVTGTGAGYEQANFFAGGQRGPMSGFENLPNPVPASQMAYDYVARQISPGPNGVAGMLPVQLIHNQTYVVQMQLPLQAGWNLKKLKAILMLIRYSDSSVLNSTRIQWPLSIETSHQPHLEAQLYPNPASGQAWLRVQVSGTLQLSITDMAGRQLWFQQIENTNGRPMQLPVRNLSPGLYLVQIRHSSGSKSLKMQVLH